VTLKVVTQQLLDGLEVFAIGFHQGRMKPSDWIMRKYFGRHRGRSWWFFGPASAEDALPQRAWLFRAAYVPIRRHVKVRRDAHPYDPAWQSYFEERNRARHAALS
jgi:hypothetical protein